MTELRGLRGSAADGNLALRTPLHDGDDRCSCCCCCCYCCCRRRDDVVSSTSARVTSVSQQPQRITCPEALRSLSYFTSWRCRQPASSFRRSVPAAEWLEWREGGGAGDAPRGSRGIGCFSGFLMLICFLFFQFLFIRSCVRFRAPDQAAARLGRRFLSACTRSTFASCSRVARVPINRHSPMNTAMVYVLRECEPYWNLSPWMSF